MKQISLIGVFSFSLYIFIIYSTKYIKRILCARPYFSLKQTFVTQIISTLLELHSGGREKTVHRQ